MFLLFSNNSKQCLHHLGHRLSPYHHGCPRDLARDFVRGHGHGLGRDRGRVHGRALALCEEDPQRVLKKIKFMQKVVVTQQQRQISADVKSIEFLDIF